MLGARLNRNNAVNIFLPSNEAKNWLNFMPIKSSNLKNDASSFNCKREVKQFNHIKMDKEWEQIQQKTFTKWVNIQLSSKNYENIKDLYHGLSDGTALIQLLEALTDAPIGKYNFHPKYRLQKIENLNKALKFIRERGINLTNIGAEDIVDGNIKLTLGMIWTIVLRFTIDDISEEGVGAKEGLLLWCQRKTAGYQGVNVQDFTYSWKDGLALCALIHRHYPELLDYHSLDKNDYRGNTALAFKVAEECIGIPQLLDVADLCDISKPDELSVMTYIASYFHAFSELDRCGTAGRRVIKFIEIAQTTYESTNDYEKRARQLLSEISEIQTSWKEITLPEQYKELKKKLIEFTQYKSTTKRIWLTEKQDLDTLLGNIHIKLKTYQLKPYNPPKGLTLLDLDTKWNMLIKAEADRRIKIVNKIKESKQKLIDEFNRLTNQFNKNLNEIASAFSKIDGELNEQLEKVKALSSKLNLIEEELDKINKLSNEFQEANIEEVEDINFSYEDLQYDFDLLKHGLNKKISFIENQIISRGISNLTPDQLEEFESSFRHFDTDDSNTLSLSEFKACLAALGNVFPDEEFEEIFYYVSDNSEFVSFEQYINFMISNTEDKVSADQLLEAFSIIADGKPYVTELDLKKQSLPPVTIDYLLQTIPQASDLTEEEIIAAEQCGEGLVLDFNAYLGDLFL
ncbi:hypothetical protein K502DRAFT_337116 [Neoconidiobolus thromboides FSU 785]|nr:hypothetical protein K502DRAFT_337116 [Neoconidiobolus thromboides FSU 785]